MLLPNELLILKCKLITCLITTYTSRQSDEHLIKCALAPPGCTTDDFAIANENAM